VLAGLGAAAAAGGLGAAESHDGREGGGWQPKQSPGRTVGTVGLSQGIPLRDIQRLLRHARPGTTLSSYDITGEALERHASHQVAGFLTGWAG
jgi:hypothetical protein